MKMRRFGFRIKSLFSIKNKLLVLPDDISVFPGHGRPTKIGDEKIYNPYL